MSYDEGLAQRLRESLTDVPELSEKKMFGGLAFLVAGNMCVGVIGDELVARVGPDAFPAAVERTGARAFDFSGRPMKGWVMVRPEGFEDDGDLGDWVGRSLTFARSLPPR
jgi:TfoX/Sxy family transcriptional regulator of competence genes